MKAYYRNIPSVHDVLEEKALEEMILHKGREHVKHLVIQAMETFRQKAEDGSVLEADGETKEAVKTWLVHHVIRKEEQLGQKGLKRVINGTGILLHTNMGRAPLPKVALERLSQVAGNYNNLEYDLQSGTRGSRYEAVERLLIELTGAEAAMVVNNNAAAVFIALNTLGPNKDVVVARSEQVEVGGSFRISDIVSRSGSKMVEVGATNKTYIRDYEEAITEDTAILLKVHKSNYRIEGFTAEVTGEAIASLGKKQNLITIEDLGSGCFLDLEDYGLPHEPTVKECVESGMDVITFSGDKLLGGPQAGIMVGKKELIAKMKKNPLTRMVRIDKLSLIGLESVLGLYRSKREQALPYVQMLHRPLTRLQEMAEVMKSNLEKVLGDRVQVDIIQEENSIGGGALPGSKKPAVALAIESTGLSANTLQKALRGYTIPIIARINEEKVIISMRTLFEEEPDEIVGGLCHILNDD